MCGSLLCDTTGYGYEKFQKIHDQTKMRISGVDCEDNNGVRRGYYQQGGIFDEEQTEGFVPEFTPCGDNKVSNQKS